MESLTTWGLTHVIELIATAPSMVAEVLFDLTASGPRIDEARRAVERARIPVRVVDRDALRKAGGPDARLVVAVLREFPYCGMAEVIAGAVQPVAHAPGAGAGLLRASAYAPGTGAGEHGRQVVVALDSVTDPGNLGAVARSARFFGAAGLIITQDRCAEVNAAALRRSAGALTALKVARVTNLVRALQELKEAGFWIYGAAARDGVRPDRERFPERSCLVLGAEDKGMRTLVARHCDVLLTVPGQFESLNVASCASVLLYEWARQGQGD